MQNMPIAIFRGDDTDALGYQTIVGTIRTDLDLTGCKAVFKYLSFSVEFDPIPENKKLTVIIPSSETSKFPPGLGYASLRVYDAEGKLCTFSNRIMVFVATKTPMFGNAEFEVDFNVRPELEPLKIFVGPNPDDFDEYRGFLEKVIDRASAEKYGLAMLLDAIDSDLGADDGVAATPVAVKAAYAAIIKKLTDDYYTADETDEAIDRVAAYYITYNASGAAFPTRADLLNAQTYYSGGVARTPTRNDYAVVLADETHDGAEWRYIYAVADGETVGQWEAQYPIETNDYTALSNKPKINNVELTGNKTSAKLGIASTADATLTPIYGGNGEKYSDWVCDPAQYEGHDIEVRLTTYPHPVYDAIQAWRFFVIGTDEPCSTAIYAVNGQGVPDDAATLVMTSITSGTLSATRAANPIIGYQLGSQTDKPLASEAEVEELRNDKLFAQYYPEGNVKSAAEFTPGIKYGSFDDVHRTVSVLPFCNAGIDNSPLIGRVVIPPFVDASGNGYISDDGTKYKVVGVSDGTPRGVNANLTTIIAPNTVTNVGTATFGDCTSLTTVSLPAATTVEENAFDGCTSLTTVSLPAATRIRTSAFFDCTSLTTVSLPAATTIEGAVFGDCTSLTSVSLPVVTNIEIGAFIRCTSLTTVDFGATPRSSVPTLGANAFDGVPTSCRIIVPDAQYDAWTAQQLPGGTDNPWYALVTAGYKFLKHSEWEYARKYEVDKKADKPATFTAGNLAALDANGNLKDSGKTPADFATAEQGGRADAVSGLFEEVPGYDIPAIRTAGFRVPWGYGGYIEFVNGGVHFYHPAAHGEPGVDYTTEWPFKTGKFATTSDIPNVSAKANDSAIAPEFDASDSYAVGDIVMHEGARYKCTTAHSGAWAAADFTAESVQEALGSGGGSGGIPADAHYVYVNSLGQICFNPDQTGGGGGEYPSGTSLSFAIAPEFSTSETYAVGEVVMYAGLRYVCSTAVSTAGEWTGSTNWTEQTLQDVIGDVESILHTINGGN